MGSSTSKAARKYPEVNKALESAVKSRSTPSATSNAARLADSHRSEAIEKDAGDPDFLSNLNKLGPVRVDHHMQTVRPEATNTKRLFDSRAKSEHFSSQPTRNKLYAFVLSDLLDKRKAVKTKTELGKLAEDFGIDVGTLENLARFVSSPSIDSASVRPAAGKSEADGFIAEAVWIEPPIKLSLYKVPVVNGATH